MRIEIRDVRVIDGLAETARDHVDVTVDGDRISAGRTATIRAGRRRSTDLRR